MRDMLHYLKHEVETVVRRIVERMLMLMSTFLDHPLAVTYFIYYIFLSTCPVDSREYKSNFKSLKGIFEKINDKRSISHLILSKHL